MLQRGVRGADPRYTVTAGCSDGRCDPDHLRDQNGKLCGFNDPPVTAWRTEHLAELLELHATDGAPYRSPGFHSGYNEVIINTEVWNQNLPHTVEAFFSFGDGDDGITHRAHAEFLKQFGLSKTDVPLVRFHPSNWDEPFAI